MTRKVRECGEGCCRCPPFGPRAPANHRFGWCTLSNCAYDRTGPFMDVRAAGQKGCAYDNGQRRPSANWTTIRTTRSGTSDYPNELGPLVVAHDEVEAVACRAGQFHADVPASGVERTPAAVAVGMHCDRLVVGADLPLLYG